MLTSSKESAANTDFKLQGWRSAFDGFLNWVLKLRKDLSIPHTLRDLNVEFDFELLSPLALKDPSTGPNPKDISLDEMKQLYIDSYEGNL